MTTTTSHNDASAWHYSPIGQVQWRPAPQWPGWQQQPDKPGPVGIAVGRGMALTSSVSQSYAEPFRGGDNSRLTSAIDRWAQLLHHSTWPTNRRWAEHLPALRSRIMPNLERPYRFLTRGTQGRGADQSP